MPFVACDTGESEICRHRGPAFPRGIALNASVTSWALNLRSVGMGPEVGSAGIAAAKSADVTFGCRMANPAGFVVHIGIGGIAMEIGMATFAPGAITVLIDNQCTFEHNGLFPRGT